MFELIIFMAHRLLNTFFHLTGLLRVLFSFFFDRIEVEEKEKLTLRLRNER